MPSKQPTRKPLAKRRKPAPKQQESVVAPVPSDVDDQAAVNSKTPKARSEDIQGLKYFDMLLPLLERLHGDQCGRDKANNRELHFDKYCMFFMLYMFNPTVTSLRAISQASELAKVQKKLGCKRTSLGSLSEASRLFDSDRARTKVPGTETTTFDSF